MSYRVMLGPDGYTAQVFRFHLPGIPEYRPYQEQNGKVSLLDAENACREMIDTLRENEAKKKDNLPIIHTAEPGAQTMTTHIVTPIIQRASIEQIACRYQELRQHSRWQLARLAARLFPGFEPNGTGKEELIERILSVQYHADSLMAFYRSRIGPSDCE
jgi:hypothetical protein